MTMVQGDFMPRFRVLLLSSLLLLASAPAFAVTDEIQVYTGEAMAVGEVGLTLHNNYTFDGLKTPDFPGGLVDNRAYSSVAEWALGVTPWFEAGLYLPLFSHSSNQSWTYNGFKLRALFVQPDNGDKDFYYGVNFEFSWNEKHWDQQVNTGEIRPIIGYHFGPVSLTVNPILDNNYKGVAALDFAPSTRLDYTINPDWTIAVEEYDDFGELRGFMPADQQSHQLFAVFDHSIGPLSIEGGVGFGLTKATDNVTFKLILSRDLTGENGIWK